MNPAWYIGAISLTGVAAFVLGSTLGTVTTAPAQALRQAPKPTDAPAPLPGIGELAMNDGWEVTLVDVGPYERFDARKPTTTPRGKRLVAALQIRNVRDRAAIFSMPDFELLTDDRETFFPVGETASIRNGFLVSQSVRSGETIEARVVFDVDSKAEAVIMTALGVRFHISRH